MPSISVDSINGDILLGKSHINGTYSLSLSIWINILIWFKHGDDNGIIMGCCKLAWMFTL